jgi:hypothetical protein
MASIVGAPWTVIGNGVVVLMGAAWFFTQRPKLRRAVRPLYEELGILPRTVEDPVS